MAEMMTSSVSTPDDSGFAFRRKVKNHVMKAVLYGSATVTVSLLLFLIGYLTYKGSQYITIELLTSQTSYIKGTIGILPNLVNTLYLIFITMVLALPISIGAAVYLTEYATNRKLVKLVEFAAGTLVGIPSIVFGLVGMLLFTQLMGLQQGLLAGGLTLVIMIMPTIMRTTQESLKSVPNAYREGALALGAGKWRTIRTVVLPNAVNGIVTGSILAVGRIVSESAALLFTAGFGLVLHGFIQSLEASSATLTVALYVYASERGETGVAFAIALILMIVTFILNIAATYGASKLKK